MYQVPTPSIVYDLENNHFSTVGFFITIIIISKRNSFLFLFYCYMIYNQPYNVVN